MAFAFSLYWPECIRHGYIDHYYVTVNIITIGNNIYNNVYEAWWWSSNIIGAIPSISILKLVASCGRETNQNFHYTSIYVVYVTAPTKRGHYIQGRYTTLAPFLMERTYNGCRPVCRYVNYICKYLLDIAINKSSVLFPHFSCEV